MTISYVGIRLVGVIGVIAGGVVDVAGTVVVAVTTAAGPAGVG